MGALLLIASLPASAASAAVIDFDDLNAPGPGGTGLPVNTQYSGQGVTFNDPHAFDYSKGTLPIPGFAHSGSVAVEPCVAIELCANPVRATLASPQRYVRVWVGYSASLSEPLGVRLTAFNASSVPVGTANATLAAKSGPTPIRTPLAVQAGDATITSLEVSVTTRGGASAGLAVDDVEFSSVAPPPPEQPDFTLDPATDEVVIEQGGSETHAIAIGRLRGSTGPIALRADGLPAGVSATFAPNPAPATQSVLTLSADAVAPLGSQAVTVTGTPQSANAGPAPRSFAIQVVVQPACPRVGTGEELVEALAAGFKCIYVRDEAEIDLADLVVPADATDPVTGNPLSNAESALVIPDGVTLMGGRSPTQPGGVLEMSHRVPPPNSAEPNVYRKIMLNLGPNTRVTGLRLRGYQFGVGNRGDGTRAIFIRESASVMVDNNEIFAWPVAGVDVRLVPAERAPRITRNFIHHNVQCSKGYGVVVGHGGFARIDRNLFAHNRHDIAGSGERGDGFIAELNFSLTSGPTCDPGDTFQHYNQHIDMHGTGDDGYGGTGGTYMEIRRNTIRGAQGYYAGTRRRPAFMLRGTPDEKAIFAENVVHNGSNTGGKGAVRVKGITRNLFEYPNPYDYLIHTVRRLVIANNRLCVDTASELAVGDFNGDGRDDVFQAVGTLWVYSPSGQREWHYLNDSNLRLEKLGLGDFNGDGKTDVFTQKGDRWLVSYGGTGDLTPLPAGSSIDIKHYRFGDFDGDGRTDVFRANGRRFVYSSAGATEWQPLADSGARIEQLRFGNFDDDATTDVFRIGANQWSVSYGGNTGWQRLNRKISSDLDGLVFADFNGDRLTDVARSNDRKWQVSWGGLTGWRTLQSRRPEPLSVGMLFGDFAARGRGEDVLQHGTSRRRALLRPCWDRFPRFQSFGRFKLSEGGSDSLSSWSSADMR